MDKLPEASDPQMRRLAAVFDFDKDSCYPSPAISFDGQVVQVNGGHSVTESDPSYTSGCRDPAQLENSNTYHRHAVIQKNGVTYVVRMYALYFVKDKDMPYQQAEGAGGHRHDWEFALVWTTDDKLTHASFSAHGNVTTKAVNELYFDASRPECVKIVYHKQFGTTHAMRFAKKDEQAENDLHQWVTPTIVDWHMMPDQIRSELNLHDFGEANCSVNDNNFAKEISDSPPTGYPSGDEWKVAATQLPVAPPVAPPEDPRTKVPDAPLEDPRTKVPDAPPEDPRTKVPDAPPEDPRTKVPDAPREDPRTRVPR